MNCPNCGTANADGVAFCGNCGTAVPGTPAPPAPPTPPGAPSPVPPAAPTVPVPPVVGGGDPTMVGGYPPGPPTGTPPTGFAAPPPGGVPPAAPVAAPAEKKSKKSLLFGLLALLVVAGLVGGYLVLSGDDGGDDAGGQIVLEPIGQTIRDDFAGDLDLDPTGSSLALALSGLPPLGSGVASLLSGLEADGDEPGLYGGTRDAATCNVEELVDFLTDDDNAEKAEAWADALGIDVDEIEDFVAGLTPLRVRFDTRVTNHGFVDGTANAFQSILEAGTAVLVDDEGVPRVKCNCGNPLAEPEDVGDVDDDDALDDSLISNPDDAWDGFDPEDVVVVSPGDEVGAFTLVDIETGELFERPVGTDGTDDRDAEDLGDLCDVLGESPSCLPPDDDDETTTTEPEDGGTTTTVVLGTGDVQITLEWGSNADLDLAVTDPNGERLSFSNRGPSSTGGQLDVDQNVGCPSSARSGVENVFWPPDQAPAGTYTVEVTGFSVDDPNRGCGSGDYELTIRVAGAEDEVIEDSVASSANGERQTNTHTFEVG